MCLFRCAKVVVCCVEEALPVACLLCRGMEKMMEKKNRNEMRIIYLRGRYFLCRVGSSSVGVLVRYRNMDKIHFVREDSVLISSISVVLAMCGCVCDDTSTV